MQAPKNKAEFFDRYARGEFGNRPRSWATLTELLESPYTGTVSARSAQASGGCFYRLSKSEAQALGPGYRYNESMPDERLVLQGEICQAERGLELSYSEEPNLRMREALGRATHVSGVNVLMVLRRHLWPSSYDDVRELITTYPDGAVEFSTYSCEVGDRCLRNTVFWEVRNY